MDITCISTAQFEHLYISYICPILWYCFFNFILLLFATPTKDTWFMGGGKEKTMEEGGIGVFGPMPLGSSVVSQMKGSVSSNSSDSIGQAKVFSLFFSIIFPERCNESSLAGCTAPVICLSGRRWNPLVVIFGYYVLEGRRTAAQISVVLARLFSDCDHWTPKGCIEL